MSEPERECAFETLYRESFPIVRNYVYYRMAGNDAAEDIIAEAYLQSARHFLTFDPSRSKFSTWVVSIAKNCISSHYRKATVSSNLDDIPESVFAVQGEQDSVDNRELIAQLLATLDDDERELVFMKYYLGMRNVEIATQLSMNASTISTKLARAMTKMRASVGDR